MSTLHTQAPPGAIPFLESTALNRALLVALRVGVAFLWIENVGWKTPPAFSALHKYTESGVTRPVFGWWAAIVEHLVLPHFAAFAWLVLLAEMTIGIFLLVGLATRFWAVVGFVQVIAITLCAINYPGEWEWSYYLMLLAHVAIFATAPGRVLGLDEIFRPRWATSANPLTKALVKAS